MLVRYFSIAKKPRTPYRRKRSYHLQIYSMQKFLQTTKQFVILRSKKTKISMMTENILSLNSPTESYCVVYEQMQNKSNSHDFCHEPSITVSPLEPPPSGPRSERYRRLETSARRARQLQRPYTPTWMESRVYVYRTACGARAKERYGQICPSPLDFLTIFRKYGRLRVPLA